MSYVISSENLNEFLQQFKGSNEVVGSAVYIGDDDSLKLKDVLKDYPNLSTEQKRSFFDAIDRSMTKESTRDWGRELFELAKDAPEAFADFFKLSGHNAGKASPSIYKRITTKMKENTFSENLYAVGALLDKWPDQLFTCAGQEDKEIKVKGEDNKDKIIIVPDRIVNPSKEERKIISTLFARAKNSDSYYSQENELLRDILDRDVLINYDPKTDTNGITSQEIRDKINEAIVKNGRIDQVDKKFIFDGHEYNKTLVEGLLKQHRRDEEFTQNNVMNKAHDPQKLASYQKFRNVMLEIAEKGINKYDSTRMGAEKTFSRRAKELMSDILGKPYEVHSSGEVIDDIVLTAAYRDIQAGRVKEIDKDTLKEVISNDPRGYWYEVIKEQTKEDPWFVQGLIDKEKGFPEAFKTDRQKALAGILDSSSVVTTNQLSSAEKEAYFNAEADKLAKQEDSIKNKELAIEVYETQKERESLEKSRENHSAAIQRITDLQKQYASIMETDATGKSEVEKKYLTKETFETLFRNRKQEGGTMLPVFQQEKLPLFGRGAEQSRREVLAQKIKEFNTAWAEFTKKYNEEYNKNGNDDKSVKIEPGKLFEKETITKLEARKKELEEECVTWDKKYQAKKEEVIEAHHERGFNEDYSSKSDYEKNTKAIEEHKEKQQTVKEKLEELSGRKAELRVKAKEQLKRGMEGKPLTNLAKQAAADKGR